MRIGMLVISSSCEKFRHNAQTVSVVAFGLSSVIQDSDRFKVRIDELPVGQQALDGLPFKEVDVALH